MSAHDEDFMDEARGERGEFVPAVIAKTVEEAEAVRELLDEHDIPAVLSTQDVAEEVDLPPGKGGVAVLVPEELLDEASEIIAEREEMDEFEAEEAEELDEDEDDELDLELEGADGEAEEEEEEDEELGEEEEDEELEEDEDEELLEEEDEDEDEEEPGEDKE